TLLEWAKKHELEVGIFGALHTYGRALNWHPHIHLSVTRGGLDKHHSWKPIQRYWNIHFAKKTKELKQTVNYLGRYLKRPPISASRLRHYSG
ncbi:transposase, partial [Vibrio sp. SG41-7]|uniref:transposase n=1 Tax=Vibrio sp. SG41-7 TaxID=2760973 RepID=UPI0016011CA7